MENEVEEDIIETIPITENQKLAEGTYPVVLFDGKSVNFHNKDLPWEYLTAYWNYMSGNGTGSVSFFICPY